MSYVGQVGQVSLGKYGLLTDQPSGEVPPGALVLAKNVSFETGMITKAPGDLRYNTQVLPNPIVGVWDWWPDVVTQRLIAVTSDGSVYKDIGDRLFSSAVAINSDLGVLTPRVNFVEGGQETALREKKLFLFTGSNQLKVMSDDGASFEDIAHPAADWTTPNYPTFGFIHRNRLWAFMKQRAYASDTGDHEQQAANNLTQAIFPGEGGDLIGGYVFKGRAFVFKEGGFVYFLDDADTDSDNWVWRRLSGKFGLSSPHGISETLDDMVAVNESGSPISYAATQKFGDITSSDVFRILQISEYVRNNTSNNGLDVIHSLYYEAKKQLYLTWRTGHRTTNDTILVLDFNKDNPRPAFWTKNQADCLALRKDAISKVRKPIYGSADGYVYFMDREDRLVGPSGYTGEFKTGHLDFRWMGENVAHKNKLFDHLAIEFLPQGSWNIAVDVYIDGKFIETINYEMDVRDDGLNSFTLGSGGSSGLTTPNGGDGDPLGREETQTIQKPLHGSGRRISFHFRQSGSNQNFAIASLSVGFRLSGEQATRV